MKKTGKPLHAMLVAAAISTFAATAHAAGLGAIQVHSGIGQPLRAEIPVQADSRELESLSARVAPPEAFREASVEYTAVMGQLQLSVDRSGSQPVVRVSSQRPINDPFVEMLVELSWATGSLRRNFTFLLDPVDRPAREAVRTPVQPSRAERSSEAALSEASGETSRTSTYTVQSGDTLHGVARRHQPQGVSPDQVMVALFRANPDAFTGQNMNRLNAGAIMSIPDTDSMGDVSAAEARREIAVQTSDFEAYRRSLAAEATRESVERDVPGQSQVGTVTRPVEEPASDADRVDRVEVSRAEGDESAESGARLVVLEEELASRERALQETNERLLALEASIRDLQQLLELRNRTLAQLQEQLEEHGEVVALPPELSGTENPASMTPVAVSGPDAPQSGSPGQAPPTEQTSPMQQVLNDRTVWFGAGGIVALLLGYTLYRINARRRLERLAGENAAAVAPVEPHVSEPAAPVSTGFPDATREDDLDRTAENAIAADDGVDPIAEADVYLAYGRDAQAGEILRDALAADPEHAGARLKLLEVYARQKDRAGFEALATEMHARTGGEGREWTQTAAMGRELDPDNPLYGRAARQDEPAKAAAQEICSSDGSARREAATGALAGAAAGAVEAAETENDGTIDAGVDASEVERPQADADISSTSDATFDDLEFSPADDAFSIDGDDAVGDGTRSTDTDGGLDFTPVERGREQREARADAASVDATDEAEVSDLNFDLSWDPSGSEDTESVGNQAQKKAAGDRWLEETLVGNELRFEPEDDPLESSAPTADAEVLKENEVGKRSDAGLLDFDLDLPADDTMRDADESSERQTPAFDFSDIDLDLDAPPTGEASGQAGAVDEEVGTSADDAFSEEVETKLDLARAYEEMGDKEGARELIDEVLVEGSETQREQAGRLLERLE